jgi:hypothetical protein
MLTLKVNETVSVQIADAKMRKLNGRKRYMLEQLIARYGLPTFRDYLKSYAGADGARLARYETQCVRERLKVRGARAFDKLADKRPGHYIRLHNQKFDPHGPCAKPAANVGVGLYLGVEIECIISRDDEQSLVDDIMAARLNGIRVGGDASINPENSCENDEEEFDCGEHLRLVIEVRVLTRIDDMSNLEAVCKLLKKYGASVNKSCGLHVHIDARSFTSSRFIVNRLAKALPLLKGMVPKSRLDNRYCIEDIGRSSRYAKINPLAYSEHKTVEVRMHSGSTDFEKIKSWCQVLHSIAFARRMLKPEGLTLSKIAQTLSWTDTLKYFAANRVRKFNPASTLLDGDLAMALISETSGISNEASEAA